MRKLDEYEQQAIATALPYIQEYVIMKTIQPVPNLCRLIGKGKRELLSIVYHRAGDPYYIELSRRDCMEICEMLKP